MCMMHGTQDDIKTVVTATLAGVPVGTPQAEARAMVIAALELAYPACVSEGADGCIARKAQDAVAAWAADTKLPKAA